MNGRDGSPEPSALVCLKPASSDIAAAKGGVPVPAEPVHVETIAAVPVTVDIGDRSAQDLPSLRVLETKRKGANPNSDALVIW